MTDVAGGASAPAGTDDAGGGGAEAAAGTTAPEASTKIAPPPVEPAPGGEGGDGGKPKGTTAAEQAARAIRADRTAENPEQSLLDALDDYMVLCGGQPLAEGWRVDMKMRVNGKSEGTYDVYYFNPEGVRFRSRAEAVRHYNLVPVAAPKGPSKSQPSKSGGGGVVHSPTHAYMNRRRLHSPCFEPPTHHRMSD